MSPGYRSGAVDYSMLGGALQSVGALVVVRRDTLPRTTIARAAVRYDEPV